jgi:hypothetical protein
MPARSVPVATARLSSRPGVLCSLMATCAMVLLLVLPGCTRVASGTAALTSMPQPAGASPAAGIPAPRSAAPEETARPGGVLPVYWLGVNGEDVQLYREFIQRQGGGDPIGAAVAAALRSAPTDPDYFTPWGPASTVTASISRENVITVDISSDAFSTSLDEGIAYRAVQQLVYTATAAAASAGLTERGGPSTVVLLVDGTTGFSAFGHIELGGAMRRDPSLVAPVWVTSPRFGDTVNGPSVRIEGSAVTSGPTLGWRVERISGGASTFREGTVRLDSPPGTPAQFSFSVPLTPGEYTVSVFQPGPAGGARAGGGADTKTVLVR